MLDPLRKKAAADAAAAGAPTPPDAKNPMGTSQGNYMRKESREERNNNIFLESILGHVRAGKKKTWLN